MADSYNLPSPSQPSFAAQVTQQSHLTSTPPIKSRDSPPSPTDLTTPTTSSIDGTTAGIPTKRGVRNLNPEQLAKKRQNDRDAQRAIRERTKTQIETLERRVKELESGQAYQHLQDVIHEREALREENASIREKLSTVMGLLNPIVDKPDTGSDDAHHTIIAEQSARPQPLRRPSTDLRSVSRTGTDLRSPVQDTGASSYRLSFDRNPQSPQPYLPDRGTPQHAPSSPSSTSTSGRIRQQQTERGQHGRPTEAGAYVGQSHPQSHHTSAASSPPNHPASPPDTARPWPPPAAGHKRPLSSLSHSPRPETYHIYHSSPYPLASPQSKPRWARTPQHIDSQCSLDNIFDDFIKASRGRLNDGVPLDDLVPRDIDFKPLVYGGRTVTDETTPAQSSLALLLADVMKGFSNVDGWPEKIGKVVMCFYYLRWYLSPTQENYEMMPAYMRPVEEQLQIRHPIWMDMVPWPALRAKIVRIVPSFPLVDFFPPYTLTLCLNWPYGADAIGCLTAGPGHTDNRSSSTTSYRSGSASSSKLDSGLPADWPSKEDDRELRVTPMYWSHVNQLENWSLGKNFGQSIPQLAGTYRIKEKEGERGNREQDTCEMGQV
ncbi:MAG: hypothetical protein M1828_003547 [Chrysothrix sp. TS-e1954]|nr:MAG: hypothetical protein M1828_003547 [Chrysothrix sp. TS-e1954]